MARLSPYQGLDPFGEQDASFFFGRERDVKLITANALTAPSVLLYGPSGVGKSSVLLAGVVPRLRERPSVLVAVCREWSGDPAERLSDVVATAARAAGHDATSTDAGFAQLLEECATALRRRIVLVFDQFEDRLAEVVGVDPFVEELADALATPGLPLSVLIAVREESLARVDRLEGYVPGLFETVYRLDHLDRAAGETAIRGPLDAWNAEAEPDRAMTLEDELVAAVLDQVPSAEDPTRIETAHLQLVLQRVWEAEREAGSSVLRRETFTDLGGAAAIVHEHVTRALDGLDPAGKALASDVLDRLVTPSGVRMAQSPADLAALAGAPLERVQSLLDELSRARVLRPVSRPEGGEAFEVFHPSLADAALAWRTRYVAERRAARERARAQRWLIAAVALAVALALVAGLATYAWTQRQTARSQAYAGTARGTLEGDPGLALALALAGVETRESGSSLAALRQALQLSHERVIFSGHRSAVNSVSVSPDGVLTTGADRTMRLWNPETGVPLRALPTRQDEILDASFCPDANRIAAAAGDGAFLLTGGRDIPLPDGDTRADAVSCTSNGSLIATAGEDGTARVFGPDGRRLYALRDPRDQGDRITGLAWSRDGALLAVAHRSGQVRVWTIGTRKPTASFQVGTEPHVAFGPDVRLLVTGDSSGTVRVVDITSDRSAASRRAPLGTHVALVTSVAVSSDGALVASAGVDGVRVWNATRGGDELAILRGHKGKVNDVAFGPDGRTIVTAGADGSARVWRTPVTVVLRGHAGSFGNIAANRAGTRIVTAGQGDARRRETVRVWDVANGRELAHIGARGAETVSIDPSGSRALIRGQDSTVIWTLDQPARLVSLPPGPAAFAPDGRSIAVGQSDSVQLFAPDGNLLRKLPMPGTGNVRAVAFSPDGLRLAAAQRAEISVIDIASGSVVVRAAGKNGAALGLAFSADGKQLVSMGTEDVQIWDATTGDLTRTIGNRGVPVLRVSFDPSGSVLLTSDEGGGVRLWDPDTGEVLASFPHHDASFVPAPDGTLLAIVGANGNAYMLRCELCGAPGELRERAREHITRSSAERDRALG